MRLFGKKSLLQNVQNAGFGKVKAYDAKYLEFGIDWIPYVPEDAPYRPLIYGLDTSPWALRSRK